MLSQNRMFVNVSELILYSQCPRQVYFTNHGYELISEITSSYIEKLLVKELGHTYPEVIRYTSKDDGISGLLESEFF